MTQQNPSLGELELEILKVIWRQQPCTVAQVAQLMASRHGHARTTVLTVIQRLATNVARLSRAEPGTQMRSPGFAEANQVARAVNAMDDGKRARYVGLVICRQQPGTATGVTFYTLEDDRVERHDGPDAGRMLRGGLPGAPGTHRDAVQRLEPRPRRRRLVW